MELRQVIETRRSVRQFTPEPIPSKDITEIVRLASFAPSINNCQPWKFICVTNKEILTAMADAVRKEVLAMLPDGGDQNSKTKVEWYSTFFSEAPCVIAIAREPYHAVVDEVLPEGVSHDEMNLRRCHPDIQSIGAAVGQLLLAATDLGYAGCWLSAPLIARSELEGILKIRTPWSLATMVAIGAPALRPGPKEQKPLSEIMEFID